MNQNPQQLSIFKAVHETYAQAGDRPMSNRDLYRRVARKIGVAESSFSQRAPVGAAGTLHSPMERTARWTQMTMKNRGLLEQVPGQRGQWQLSKQGKHTLHRPAPGTFLVGFSTRLGLAMIGDCRDCLRGLGEPITLCLTSPPYALAKPRAYGNPDRTEYLDFICASIEPVVKALAPGGFIALNLTNDTFEPNSPARTLTLEYLTIRLHETMGLFLFDRLIWVNESKAPGPVRYASITRQHLNVKWEPILVFTNSPKDAKSCNNRVLEPHSERHQKLIAVGGEKRSTNFGDGAYRLRPGSFGNPTAGRIPGNVLHYGTRTPAQCCIADLRARLVCRCTAQCSRCPWSRC